jgi:hypothetical protein
MLHRAVWQILTDVSKQLTVSHGPDDEESKLLSNVSQYVPDYTEQHLEHSHPHTRSSENLKSYIMGLVVVVVYLTTLFQHLRLYSVDF